MKEGRFLQGHRLAAFFTGPRRPALLAALLTLGLLVMVWWGAHHWYKGQLLADRRAQILTELSPYSNALSRAINRRLGLLRGLKAFVEARASAPTFGAEFETFAAGLYAGTAGMRHFVAAPGGVLRYVYPLAGNESVLGYDILHDSRPNVRADVERAIRSRLLTVSGPFELLPGGSGFVGRLAVYVNDKFWGLVSVAVDLAAILEETGIRPHTAGLLLALRNELGHPFFGNSAVFNDQPVLHRIELVEGFWELAAIPTGGWNASIRRALRLFDLAALAIASLLTAVVYLAVNRDARLALGVQERTEELRKAHDELEIRVRERTAELAKSNEALQTEIGERKRAEEEVRFLATLAQAVSEAPDFNSALGIMLRKVCESTGWDYGEAWVLSQDATALECSPVWYGSGERLERFRKAASGIRRSPGVGLIGRVWASKKPEWLPDVSVSPGLFYRARAAHEARLKAGLGLPILAGDQLLAVLVFSMFESREKDKRLVEIVSAAGMQLGSVLQRKQMEQALLEGERRFHGIFNQTYQFVGLLNPDGILLEANKTALDFQGLQRSDVVGRPFWETAWWDTSPDTRDRLKAAIADAARGNFIRYEVDLLGPDGSVNTFDFSLKPVTDESGQVVLLIPEGRNITNRKRMEEELRRAREELELRVQERTGELAKTNEELRRSEERYRSLFETAGSVIVCLSPDHRILEWNPEAERLTGWRREEVLGKDYFEIFLPNVAREAVNADTAKVLAGERTYNLENPVRTRDGRERLLSWNVTRLLDPQDRPIGIIAIGQDITERKRAESWLRSLIETTQDAVVSIDRKGQVVLFNPAAEQIFGYTRAEVEGKKVDLLMAEPFSAEHDDYIGRYEHTGERRAIGRIRTATARRKNGEVFPVELSVTEVSTSDEVRYAAFIRDISEKTRLQEQLIESERLAAIGTTAAKLGHEIANPLNGMSMTLQLLERRLAREAGQVDAGAASAVKRLKDEIARLSQLLEDFRSISRREKYSFQPTALATVAGEVFAVEMENYRARRIQVEQDFPPDLSLVMADRDKLKQALLNLCKNAVEAMPQGGTLTVRASNAGEQVVLEIMDTGVGIPAEVDIFELFSTTKASGTGLGLVIVRQIVAAHGGTITYASEPGKGTTFRLTLPIFQSLGSKQFLVSSRQ